jgi:hypothetical protein
LAVIAFSARSPGIPADKKEPQKLDTRIRVITCNTSERCFPGGLFGLAWSGFTANIHWIIPTASRILTGFGLFVFSSNR